MTNYSLPVSPIHPSSFPSDCQSTKSTLPPQLPSPFIPHYHFPLYFLSTPPSVCQENQFALTPVFSVTFLPFTVWRPLPLSFPLSLSVQGSGRGLALHSAWCRRDLRHVMLQQCRVKGHGCHRDRAGSTWVLAITVGVVDLLWFCLTGKTGSEECTIRL